MSGFGIRVWGLVLGFCVYVYGLAIYSRAGGFRI